MDDLSSSALKQRNEKVLTFIDKPKEDHSCDLENAVLNAQNSPPGRDQNKS